MLKKYFYLLFILLLNQWSVYAQDSKKYNLLFSKLQNITQLEPNIHLGIEIRSLKENKIIYQFNPHQLFIPASNTKLVTAVLALETLGTDYQFETSILTDSFMAENGTIENLFLRGSGDPSLTDTNLENLVQALNAAGIKKITGTVYIDATAFDNEPFSSGIFLDDVGLSWNTPMSALMINRKPAAIDGTTQLVKLSAQSIEFFDLTSFLKNLFEKYSITWNGTIAFKNTPKNAKTLASHHSEPLMVLIGHMLKSSDNLYADCLFKQVGAVKYGTPGTWQKGISTTKDFLQQKIELNDGEYIIEDGSGRSRYNSLSPNHIVRLLSWVTMQPYFPALIQNLSTAGVDGTLQERMKCIKSLVHAKTGTLPGVSALSGYIDDNGDLLAFSILINGFVQSKSMAGQLSVKYFRQIGRNYKTDIEDAFCVALIEAMKGTL